MTDDRPAPQYGEYATPEQQAAAMGHAYVAPLPPPPAGAPHPAAPAPPGEQLRGQQQRGEQLRGNGHFIDRFVTVFQLGIGLLFLISSDWFHLAENANSALAETGITTRLPTSVDKYGWVLLGVNILFLLATIVWAYATLRRGRRAYYIPFVGYFAFSVVGAFVIYAILR
jgi:hypothetical protein